MRTSAPLRASQTFAVLSQLAVTMREPSGLNDRRSDGSGVPLEREDLGAAPRVPDLRRPVATRGDDARAVGAERRRDDGSVCPLSVRTSAPLCASQTFAVLSELPVTMREPSGLNDAESTRSGVPLEREDLGAARASQTFAVLSLLAVTMREPSGLNDAELTSSVCPLSVRTSAPVCASQTFAVPSLLPVTMREPSGLNDAERTAWCAP